LEKERKSRGKHLEKKGKGKNYCMKTTKLYWTVGSGECWEMEQVGMVIIVSQGKTEKGEKESFFLHFSTL